MLQGCRQFIFGRKDLLYSSSIDAARRTQDHQSSSHLFNKIVKLDQKLEYFFHTSNQPVLSPDLIGEYLEQIF